MVDNVNHPPHYKKGSIECIDAIEAALTFEQFFGYCKAAAIKYIWRCDHKDANIRALENSISDKIGLNVIIKNNKRNKGTITFSYSEIDQLNKIIEIIKSNY